MQTKNDFTLKIHHEKYYYAGETDVESTVTYPGMEGLPDITIRYGQGYDDTEGRAAERAAHDIARFMLEPLKFLEAAAISGNEQARLSYLLYRRSQLERYAADHKRRMEENQKDALDLSEEIAELEKQIRATP